MRSNKFIFNYGSIEQTQTGQDIEEREFNSMDEMMIYVLTRVETNKNIVYIFMHEKAHWKRREIEEFPSAFVTRVFAEINWVPIPGRFFLFEVDCYEEAFGYLKDCFETSSLMYPKEEGTP